MPCTILLDCANHQNRIKKIMKNKTLSKSLLFWIITISGMFLFLLLINFFTPFMGEDYALIYSNEEWLPNLLHQLDPINAWSLRLGDTFTTLVFFGCQKVLFNFINTAMIVAFTFLLFFWGKGRMPKKESLSDLAAFLLGFALFYVCSANIGEIFFWASGATNYLWSCVMLFAVCAPFRKALADDSFVFTKKWYLILLYVFVCFFAGWTNENSVPIMILLGGFVLLKKLIRGGFKNLPIWLLSSVFSLGIGYAVLAFSPSTKNRAAAYRLWAGLPEKMNFAELIENARRVVGAFFESNAKFLLVILLIVIFLSLWKTKRNEANRASNIFMIALSSVSVAVLFFNCYTENRSFMFVQFLIISYVIGVFSEKAEQNPLFEKIKLISPKLRQVIPAVLMFVLLVHSLFCTFNVYSWYHEFDKNRSADIRAQVAEDKETVEFTNANHKSRYLNTREDYLTMEIGYIKYKWHHGVKEGIIFK